MKKFGLLRKIWKYGVLPVAIVAGIVAVASTVASVAFLFGGEYFGVYLGFAATVVALSIATLQAIPGVGFLGKHKRVVWSVFTGVIVALVAAYSGVQLSKYGYFEVNGFEIERYPEVNTVGVLNEPSTLKLTDSLPLLTLENRCFFYPLAESFTGAVYPPQEEARDYSYDFGYVVDGYSDIMLRIQAGRNWVWDFDLWERAYVDSLLRIVPIGREALVFFVNAKNPVNDLSQAQLRDIYSGRTTNWQELGGRRKHILAFQNQWDESRDVFEDGFMAGEEVMTPPQDVWIYTFSKSYRNNPGAIGYLPGKYVKAEIARQGDTPKIKMLSVDGFSPYDEGYPLMYDIVAITRADNHKQNVGRFLEWMTGPQGQELVRKSGFQALRQTGAKSQ